MSTLIAVLTAYVVSRMKTLPVILLTVSGILTAIFVASFTRALMVF